MAFYQSGGDRRGAARSLNNLGYIYERLGESRKAMEYYERALTEWRALGDRTEESRTLMNAGSVYARMNAPQKAMECYQQSLRLRQGEIDRRDEGIALLMMGDLRASTDPRKALENYASAPADASRRGSLERSFRIAWRGNGSHFVRRFATRSGLSESGAGVLS
jgi:tetratricopeptide (TPR) repeat protein